MNNSYFSVYSLQEERFVQLAADIVCLFPGEVVERWYLPGNSLKNASGLLYIKYMSERSDLRDRKLIQGSNNTPVLENEGGKCRTSQK